MSLRDAFGVPLAVKRLERLPDGRVRVGMKRVWSDGTGAVEFTVLEVTEKLAAIVPPAGPSF